MVRNEHNDMVVTSEPIMKSFGHWVVTKAGVCNAALDMAIGFEELFQSVLVEVRDDDFGNVDARNFLEMLNSCHYALERVMHLHPSAA